MSTPDQQQEASINPTNMSTGNNNNEIDNNNV
jgi:hypothetical protein